MRRKYPKPENMKFLICEQARPELHQKLSLLGYYPGDHIVFYPKVIGQYPYTLATLSFVFVLQDGVGEFDVSFELIGPDGKSQNKVLLSTVNLKSKGTSGSVVNLTNMQFNAEGVFHAALHLGNKRYDFPFRVSASDDPIPR